MGAAVATLLPGCAQQEMPPGGPEDRRPPVVVETFPEPLGVLEDTDAAVRFRFDERISERVSGGDLANAVTVSPRSGPVRVSKGSRSLEVRPEGGFLPGLVYRVTLQPVVSDLFGNQLADPFELVFTTGGMEPVPTTLAGEVWDRITGRPIADALVLAVSPDGLIHQATSDRRGIYAFRYLPGGELRLTAFEDRNRDGEPDSTEVQGTAMAEVAVGDTLLVDLAILDPDTAAAVVTEAEPLDSVTVVVAFDDYLDPDADPAAFDVTVAVSDTTPAGVGIVAPDVRRVFQEAGYASHVQSVADSLARLDSIAAAEAARAARAAADSARRADSIAAADSVSGGDSASAVDTAMAGDPPAPADTLVAPTPPDTVVMGAPGQQQPAPRVPPTELRPLQGERPGPTRDGRRVLPGRRIVVVLDAPLAYDVTYAVEVDGVRNIAGLEGGGGRAELVLERPPPPDTTVSNSAAVTDTGALVDTAAVPDTGAVMGTDRGSRMFRPLSR